MRKTDTERKADLLKRKRRIERQLAGLDARERVRERKLDTRRKIVAGAIVLRHAEKDAAFAKEVAGLLERFVLDRDRHLFGLPDRADKGAGLKAVFALVAAVPQRGDSESAKPFGEAAIGRPPVPEGP